MYLKVDIEYHRIYNSKDEVVGAVGSSSKPGDQVIFIQLDNDKLKEETDESKRS